MVSVFLTIPTNKPLETAFSLKTKSSETIITNHDLLQAKNQGRVQLNNSVNITVYPSYRNAGGIESSGHKKIPLYEMITLVVPAMVLLSAVIAFRVTIGDVDGWEALFPSLTTCPIVAKLTVWGSLIVIVAYEYSFQFYGSKAFSNGAGGTEGLVGLEVIVDNGYLAYDEGEIHAIDSVLSDDDGASSVYVSQSECAPISATSDKTSVATKSDNLPANTKSSKRPEPLSPANITRTSIEVKTSSSISEMPTSPSTVTPLATASTPTSAPTPPPASSKSVMSPNPPTPSTSSATKMKAPSASIPFRFIRATKGDVAAAKERWADTCKWRKEMGMNTILQEPHPSINVIKQHYPHYFHLRGKKNECCYYEQPPKMNLAALRKEGIQLESLLRHYALCCEYMWNEIEDSEEGKSIYVIDLNGIGFRDFAGEVVDFVTRASKFTGDHYPERSGSIFIINVPSWFSVIWNVVKPMVDDVTKQKITIMKYGQEAITKALMEKIDINNIPPEYGGRSMPLGQSPEEIKFMKHFDQLNNRS